MSKPVRAPITVGELIEKLSEFPAEMPVLVDGHEGGYDTPGKVYALNVDAREGDAWWWGEFDDGDSFAAVVIPR